MIKVSSKVSWEHSPNRWYNQGRPFKAKGTVVKLYESHVAGKKRATVAKVKVHSHDYWKQIGRSTTVISLGKLR